MNSFIGRSTSYFAAAAGCAFAGSAFFCGEQAARSAAQAAKVTKRCKLESPKSPSPVDLRTALPSKLRPVPLRTVSRALQRRYSRDFSVADGEIASVAARLREA